MSNAVYVTADVSRAEGINSKKYGLVAKRVLDISVAVVGLTFLSPLMLFVAAAIKILDNGPIIFAHTRIGQNGRSFEVFKFRSMVVDADKRLAELLERDPDAAAEWKRDQKLTQDPRITRLGAFLRKSSIDELPQFMNVLRGDMSVVGPRPVTENEVERYGSDFRYYAAVKPGITGVWQVSGRNKVDYDQRVILDKTYAQNATFTGDVAIILKTIPAVLASKGAS